MSTSDRGARAGWTLALCFLAALCEGFDIQSVGVAAPQMAPALRLGRGQLGPVFSASILGLFIGAVVLGRVADRFGRKRMLIASLAAFGTFSLATAATTSLGDLLAVRLLAGVGLGGAFPTLVALSAEAVAAESRARLVTRVTCGFALGAASCGVAAAGLGWRGIFYVGGLAPLALAAVMAGGMSESRAFLAARDGASAHDGFLWILFGGGRATRTLLLWTASFASLLSLYLLVNWLPTLLADRGLASTEASLVSVLFNLGAAVGILILAELLDQSRPRRTIGFWYLGLGLSLVILARTGAGFPTAAVAGFAVGFFVASAPQPLYGLAPGCYGVAMRGAGVGASVAVGRLGAILGPLLAAALLDLGAGASGVLLGLLPIASAAGGATIALIARPALAD
jgi:AAHS family 3-hydroxyphenylpropionic acid transporter